MENIRNPSKPLPTLTWKDILDEEPFEGQHWEGVQGLPLGSTVENWDTHSGGSTPSLSPVDDLDDLDDLDDSPSLLASPELLDDTSAQAAATTQRVAVLRNYMPKYHHHRRDFEELQARQYWRADWRTDADTTRPFDIGDASTLGGYECSIRLRLLNISIHSFRAVLSTRSSRIFDDWSWIRPRGEIITSSFASGS